MSHDWEADLTAREQEIPELSSEKMGVFTIYPHKPAHRKIAELLLKWQRRFRPDQIYPAWDIGDGDTTALSVYVQLERPLTDTERYTIANEARSAGLQPTDPDEWTFAFEILVEPEEPK